MAHKFCNQSQIVKAISNDAAGLAYHGEMLGARCNRITPMRVTAAASNDQRKSGRSAPHHRAGGYP